ncbi:hypothetical protein DPEC_G00295330 [Dallia pectoralis]|uniref:Uncharacterized protein n=1 Tax=Dallia pectoralis TaxID=75939 RepID=A0ACC2FIS6_DALPE|nr:hypothetical protein DPEC_G00295330 [Dallia pectoralis]
MGLFPFKCLLGYLPPPFPSQQVASSMPYAHLFALQLFLHPTGIYPVPVSSTMGLFPFKCLLGYLPPPFPSQQVASSMPYAHLFALQLFLHPTGIYPVPVRFSSFPLGSITPS